MAGAAGRADRAPGVRRAQRRGRASSTALLTRGGRRRAALVLLAGDAGIGKTRLAAELAQRAHERGAVVLYGRFDEETLAPYQPLVEMLRGLVGGRVAGAPCAPRLGARAAELGIVLPEFGPPRAPTPSSLRGDEVRTPSATASSTRSPRCWPRSAAARRCVLVLDDLHWADRATLQLLRHLVRGPRRARALFLATYRERRARGRPSAARAGRRTCAARAGCGGSSSAASSAPEVAELVEALDGGRPTPAFLAALHAETEGNPFFIEEVVRHLLASAGELGDAPALAAAGVPDGVREVIARRLRRLGEPGARGAHGRVADRARVRLRRAGGRGRARRRRARRRARRGGRGARAARERGQVGRYEFAHALIRATLYGRRLGAAPRAAARPRRRGDPEPRAAPTSIPGCRSSRTTSSRPRRSTSPSARSTSRSPPRGAPTRLLAWEEAADHYRAALRARELAATVADPVRAELLLALGASQQRAGTGERRRARRSRRPATTARRLGDAGAAGPRRAGLRRAVVDARARRRGGRRAARRGARWRSARRTARCARGCSRGSASSSTTRASRGAARRLSEEAVDDRAPARRPADARGLPRRPPLRAVAARRTSRSGSRWPPSCATIAEQVGDPELELEGAGWTVVDLLELGDIEGVDIQIAAASELAEALQRPLYLWWTARVPLHAGADRRRLRRWPSGSPGRRSRSASAGRPRTPPTTTRSRCSTSAASRGASARSRSRCAGSSSSTRRSRPGGARSRCCWSSSGARTRRAASSRRSPRPGFAALPRDANWLIAVTLLAEVCGALGDAARAAELYRMLEPYAGRNVIVGRNATCNGARRAAARDPGRRRMGDWDAARAPLRRGARDARGDGRAAVARAHAGRVRGDAAGARRADDVDRASELLADAIVVADALGMVVLGEHARSLVPALGCSAVSAGGLWPRRNCALKEWVRLPRRSRGGLGCAYRNSAATPDCGVAVCGRIGTIGRHTGFRARSIEPGALDARR